MFTRSIVAASRSTDCFFSFAEAFVSIRQKRERSEIVGSHSDCTLVPLCRLFSLTGTSTGPSVEIVALGPLRIGKHRKPDFWLAAVEPPAQRNTQSPRRPPP